MHVTYGRGSVLLWRRSGKLCTSGFTGMTSYLLVSQGCSTSPRPAEAQCTRSLGLGYKLCAVIPVYCRNTVEQPWLMSKYDVIHETGSTSLITTPPWDDRATATGNMQKKLGKDRTSSSEDLIVDSQTHRHTNTQTNRQTRSSQYSASLSAAE